VSPALLRTFLRRKVSFIADLEPPGPSGDLPRAFTGPELDGVIGQFKVYCSGGLTSILPSLPLTKYLGDLA
jgi:hypothetical protein